MKQRIKKHIFVSIIVMFLILILLLVYYFVAINPVIIANIQLSLDSISKKAINRGIIEVGYDKALYNDLINITYRDNGDISLISINTYEANRICNQIIKLTENNINKFGQDGIDINAGIFTSIPLFSVSNKSINLKFQQIGAVNCTYHSKFISAGINQNIHRLYVEINTKVGVALPFHTEAIDVKQEYLLCENIFIGDIPYTYLQSTELDSLLNLVPS